METISGPFWSQAGTLRAKVATQTAKKGVWREVQNQGPRKVNFGTSRKGVQSVHSLTIAPFSLFHPCPFWLHFGLHFGVTLGAKFATILFFGRPGNQQDPQIGTCFSVMILRVPAGPLRGANKAGGRGRTRDIKVIIGVPKPPPGPSPGYPKGRTHGGKQ